MDTSVSQKECTFCLKIKPLSDFYEHPHCSSGHFPQCKPCYLFIKRNKIRLRQKPVACVSCGEADQSKFYYTPDGRRPANRCKRCTHLHQKRFGVSLIEREAMEASQDYKCAICGREEVALHQNGTPKRLAIDHDHQTNQVRGLLCYQCNNMLGCARDDINVLLNAIEYLKKYKSPTISP